MRANIRAIHGIGDFVPSKTNGFLATLGPTRGGVGDFVPSKTNGFLATLGPVKSGMGHIGCGSDCGCGPCRSGNGMGQIDFSLTGDGIATSLGSALSITSMPAIPNWVIYAGGVAIIYAIYSSERHGRRR
jgi:hypothetical protein